jgi:hypothetical protein
MEMFDMELFYNMQQNSMQQNGMQQNETSGMYQGPYTVNNGMVKVYSVILFTFWFWYIL